MSSLKIEERIEVGASPARVWAFLLDPARVAACLPGARLDGTEGDRTLLGTMKVKVGPVTMEFKGKATMSEVVESERRVTLTGTGNDKGGSGSAKMDMHSQIEALAGGGSAIVVVADVDLSGKLVTFGRGMMQGISKQLFKQFAERVRAELPAGAEEAEVPAKAEAPAQAEEPKAEEPKAEAPAEAAESEKAAVSAAAAEPAVAAEPEKAVPPPEPVKKPAPLAAPADNAPLDAGSLFWTVVWDWIKGLFRRVFGRRA